MSGTTSVKPTSHSGRGRLAWFAVLLAAGGFCVGCAQAWDLPYLAFVGLIPLFASIRFLAPIAAMGAGAFWGVCVFAFLAVFGEIPVSQAFIHFGALAAIAALYAYLGARLTLRVGFSPYLLGLGWMGVELALASLGTGDGLLAPALGDGPIAHAVHQFVGGAVVAFFVAYVNVLLFTAVSVACVSASFRRYASASGARPEHIHPRESFSDLFTIIRQLSPRAPPLPLT